MRMIQRRMKPDPASQPIPEHLRPTPPDIATEAHIREYLDAVCAHLPRGVPPTRRQELRRELTAHLLALTDAYVELGSDPDTAVLEALRQFGSARSVGREWAREWKRPPCGEAPSWAVALTIVPFLGSGLLFSSLGALSGLGNLAAWLGTLTPWLAGYAWAHLRPGQPRVFRLLVCSVLLSALCMPLPAEMQSPVPLVLFARLLMLMLWTTIACSSAGLTAALRVLRERLRSQHGTAV